MHALRLGSMTYIMNLHSDNGGGENATVVTVVVTRNSRINRMSNMMSTE